MKKKILGVLILAFVSMLMFTHSGRTDSKGGHWNRKTGTYHYHNSKPSKSGGGSGPGCRMFSATEKVVEDEIIYITVYNLAESKLIEVPYGYNNWQDFWNSKKEIQKTTCRNLNCYQNPVALRQVVSYTNGKIYLCSLCKQCGNFSNMGPLQIQEDDLLFISKLK